MITTPSRHSGERGIALIIVMMVIVILTAIAGGFAYSMKIETKLARNSAFETDMEFLGRSGVELGRYVLGQQLAIPGEGAYTSLDQKWAGGWGGTNELLADIQLENVEMGPGKFTVKIVDMERKFNISQIRENNSVILEKGLTMIGVDQSDISTIVDSFLDWTDPDEKSRPHGAESQYYRKHSAGTPYFAKNGPIDDLSEMLMIKGITPEIFYGSGRTGRPVNSSPKNRIRRPRSAFLEGNPENGVKDVGLMDLFTPISGSGVAVNVNTVSAAVLEMLPGIDAAMADAIVAARDGSDRTPGTEDDVPFHNTGELRAGVPGLDPQIMGSIQGMLAVQSFVFEITVTAEIGNYRRKFVALVHRRNRTDVPILNFHWE